MIQTTTKTLTANTDDECKVADEVDFFMTCVNFTPYTEYNITQYIHCIEYNIYQP